jgi:hypothetical protein
MRDDEYPDWLWSVLDDPKLVSLAEMQPPAKDKGEHVDFSQERKRLKGM